MKKNLIFLTVTINIILVWLVLNFEKENESESLFWAKQAGRNEASLRFERKELRIYELTKSEIIPDEGVVERVPKKKRVENKLEIWAYYSFNLEGVFSDTDKAFVDAFNKRMKELIEKEKTEQTSEPD